MPNEYGQNWTASYIAGGTPGQANSAWSPPAESVALVAAGAAWAYWDGGGDLEDVWRVEQFDDSAWDSGPAPLGYGGNGEVTVINYGEDASNKHITYYFRHRFTVADLTRIEALVLRIMRDDGAVVYINDTEVARSNMAAGPVDATTTAAVNVRGADETTFFTYPVSRDVLVEGVNLMAVEVHQIDKASVDLGFDLSLEAILTSEPMTDTRNLAPMILDVKHWPVIPHSDEAVQVTARLLDEQSSGIAASVHYRVDGQAPFASVPMMDDGLGADSQPGDGLYGATIPIHVDGTIVELSLIHI